jgi:hypothetical protein
MTDEEKIMRLSCVLVGCDGITELDVMKFLKMYKEMQNIDYEEAEEQRIEHARAMSSRKR